LPSRRSAGWTIGRERITSLGTRKTSTKKACLIVGVGGLGVPAVMALARGGATRLGLIDPDPVELSNLTRQIIYGTSSLGRPKVKAAAERLRERWPKLNIETYEAALDASNGADLIARHDFIIDATDSPVAKFLINDTCLALSRPFVYAGVLGMTGQAMTVLPARTACLRCLFEEPPDPDEVANCRDAGIIGPVAALVGEIEAAEALRCLRGEVPELAGKILTYDGTTERIRVTPVSARVGCGCGAARSAVDTAAATMPRNQ
jgi:molybdopterin-synthase adenylyltransferase